VAIYLNENIHTENIQPQTFDATEEAQDEVLDELLHGDDPEGDTKTIRELLDDSNEEQSLDKRKRRT